MRNIAGLLLLVAGCVALVPPAAPALPQSAGNGITPIVTSDDSLGIVCDVVAVISMPSTAIDRPTAFAELSRRAFELGGHAVVSARADPGWVSGVVVRSKAIDPRPYDVIARVDAQTDEHAPDAGLDALRERGEQLGADKLVDIRYEHRGADGRAHLSAQAVRYRR